MKKIFLFSIHILVCFLTTTCQTPGENIVPERKQTDRTILVYGNGLEKSFISYVIALTGKEKPKVTFFPTAAADNPLASKIWSSLVADLPLEPEVVLTFINSSPDQKTFAEQILTSDAIIVGGGNTLNMIAIWKAQGIDTLLRAAYEKGIVLAGGSAGSLCWFTGGYSDSRPQKLSVIECLGFLNYSHCPHYNEPERKRLYTEAIKEGILKPGYACENGAGLLFINERMVKSLSLSPDNNNYFVTTRDEKLVEEKLKAEILKTRARY
ncbi:MAG: peptidase E [Bacteroidales bacterium]|nr:peptidase E [Bacteroidales bacterium]MBN2632409.1 peptidase E [Bacteroidales bacterium]